MTDTAIATSAAHTVTIEREHRDIFNLSEVREEKSWVAELFKIARVEDKEDQSSSQGVNLGIKQHPFNMIAAVNFKNQNVHHSTCIEAKTKALVGAGFANEEKIEKELDPLCDSTFNEELNSVAEDYWQTGNGYLEVIRDDGKKITGLHHVPAASVQIVIEDLDYNKHYLVGNYGEEGNTPMLMAPFGELEDFLDRMEHSDEGEADDTGIKDLPVTSRSYTSAGTISDRSEIIHFARRTSMSRWYGYPDWLSAVASIELVQMMTQERYDFFLNRGVPEFLLFITGAKLDAKTWEKIENGIKATIGLGNQHKSMALNIDSTEVQVKVEKLAMESGTDGAAFSTMSETLALDIVTAHRTPPLLAGIQIPGKLGAVNELPNALLAFQVLVIGPEQVTFQRVLGATLGNQKLNGGLSVRKKDFTFKKITEEIPLGIGGQTTGQGGGTGKPGKPGIGEMDTMSRMRTPAAAGGRNLSNGLKKKERAAHPEE